MSLDDVVKERKLSEAPEDDFVCPYCGGQAEIETHRHTLVGGTPDPNHHWQECTCRACHAGSHVSTAKRMCGIRKTLRTRPFSKVLPTAVRCMFTIA
jgi:hypothetical protein